MKYLIIFTSIVLITFSSCTKNNSNYQSNPACSETPPTDELCQAAFKMWFYNQSKNTCEEIAYSGCSRVGFETKQECEECDCNN